MAQFNCVILKVLGQLLLETDSFKSSYFPHVLDGAIKHEDQGIERNSRTPEHQRKTLPQVEIKDTDQARNEFFFEGENDAKVVARMGVVTIEARAMEYWGPPPEDQGWETPTRHLQP